MVRKVEAKKALKTLNDFELKERECQLMKQSLSETETAQAVVKTLVEEDSCSFIIQPLISLTKRLKYFEIKKAPSSIMKQSALLY